MARGNGTPSSVPWIGSVETSKVRWQDRREELTAYARSFDRSAVLLSKSHWFGRVLCVLVFWMSHKRFMEDFASTVGPLCLLPDAWSAESTARAIPHEVGGHTRQFRWFGLWLHPWVGVIPMGIVYALILFPILLAYFRYRLELHADSQRWRTLLMQGQASPSDVMNRALYFADLVAGVDYLWAWPRPLVRWGFEHKVKRVIAEYHAARR